MKNIMIVAALDTKSDEVLFIKDQIEKLGAQVITVDAGILGGPSFEPTFTREKVAEMAGTTIADVRGLPSEGDAMDTMIKGAVALTQQLYSEGKINGVLGIGGAMGTALGTACMRALPIGVGKVMVSTVVGVGAVSGPAVGFKDIAMYHSVADVAGLNRLTRTIFANAAGAIVGMANTDLGSLENKKLVAVSTLGTTEATAARLRAMLAAKGYEAITFHTTGVGGGALEQTVLDGIVDGGVIEVSQHEWIDRIAGGFYQAVDHRYESAGQMGLPQVYVPGSTDFVVQSHEYEPFAGRIHHAHNRAIMLWRTSPEEMRQLGADLGQKLSKSKGPVTVMIPLKGYCVHDREGGPLWYPEADQAFVEGIEPFVKGNLKLKKVEAHVNDEKFAEAVLEEFLANAALV